MPWGRAGGQNIEHLHTLVILSSFFFFCFKCIVVLLVRHSSGDLRCSGTALIEMEELLLSWRVQYCILHIKTGKLNEMGSRNMAEIKCCLHRKISVLKGNIAAFFRENRCPPLPKPVYGGNFSHEAVTLRSRSPKSNKLLILSDLCRLANLVTFHPIRKLKIRSRSSKPIQLFIMSKCYIHANLVKICQLVHVQAPFGSNLAV